MLADPCNPSPCGNLGVCVPDGNSYKCICNDGKTVTTFCINNPSTTALPSVMLTSTVIPSSTSRIRIQSTPVSNTVVSFNSVAGNLTTVIITTSTISGFATTTHIPSPSKIHLCKKLYKINVYKQSLNH